MKSNERDGMQRRMKAASCRGTSKTPPRFEISIPLRIMLDLHDPLFRLAPIFEAMRLRNPFFLALFALTAVSGHAQSISPGLSAGVPINHFVTAVNGQVATTARYTFGPTLRVGLPHGFGFDVDFLYKRLDLGFVPAPDRIPVHRMELPLMLRYVFSGLPLRPFVHAGISFNRIIAIGGGNTCTGGSPDFYCIGGKTAAQLRHRHTHGPVLGAGLSFRRGRFRPAPEIRFTRWVDRNFGTRDSPLRSNLTQIELLLSVNF